MKYFQSLAVLIVLGFSKPAAAAVLNYPTLVREYGVHWNFYMTLAALRVRSKDGKEYGNNLVYFSLFHFCHQFFHSSLAHWVQFGSHPDSISKFICSVMNGTWILWLIQIAKAFFRSLVTFCFWILAEDLVKIWGICLGMRGRIQMDFNSFLSAQHQHGSLRPSAWVHRASILCSTTSLPYTLMSSLLVVLPTSLTSSYHLVQPITELVSFRLPCFLRIHDQQINSQPFATTLVPGVSPPSSRPTSLLVSSTSLWKLKKFIQPPFNFQFFSPTLY